MYIDLRYFNISKVVYLIKQKLEMNKKVKYLIIALNIIVFVIAGNWYMKEKNTEPLIALITQFIALVALFFEEKISKISNIKNVDTDIDTNISAESNVEVLNEKNKGSNIRTTIS